MSVRVSILLYIIIFCIYVQFIACVVTYKSPFYQFLPDCTKLNDSGRIFKKTSKRGIVCPIVKDEEGFLSEFTAYYELHGFNHVVFYDNNSTSSFAEVQPWIDSGFVTIRRNWWVDNPRIRINISEPVNFYDSVKPLDFLNELAGIDCKLIAQDLNIDIVLSVDLDEYAIPMNPQLTLMDDLDNWFRTTQKNMIIMRKLNYNSAPHFHEPIHLLSIEAYQTRYPVPAKMSYYVTTGDKTGYLLKSPNYNQSVIDLLTFCCSFHGCLHEMVRYHSFNGIDCNSFGDIFRQIIWNKKVGSWLNLPSLNHYARSLEKFLLKQESWSDLARQHNDSAGNPQGLSIYNFMNRAYGTLFDDRAVKYGCQVRELLYKQTGIKNYLRPGDMWYKNIEFGKHVNNPLKRGRHGKGENIKVRKVEWTEYPPWETYQAAHSDKDK